jgi:dipeptidyl aminopeptidase/acylaminoacyl peptidase
MSAADRPRAGTGDALAAGARVGPYEIESRLGAGAMGEVYRARDRRLGRDVALKVIPAGEGGDREALRRFEIEARAASTLNHPNLVTVFDVGTGDAVAYIAMELVDGDTLALTMSRGAMAPRKAVAIAAQIAEGLAAAHEHGLVHRDLKPQNVMLARDGRVKILDFGLAKVVRLRAPGPADPTESILPPPTIPGTVMGTVGYMSPEQAAGVDADFRSDQFSLGAILYEMITGRSPFRRETVVDTLSAVLHDDPPPIVETAPDCPVPLRWIVERLLARNREDRYASTADLARDLRQLRDRASEIGGSAAALAEASRPRIVARAAAVLALLAALAAAFFAASRPRPAPLFQQLTFRHGTIWSARFAPDGSTVFYGAAWEGNPFQLYSTRLPGSASRVFPMPVANLLAVSRAGDLAVSLGSRPVLAGVTSGTLARLAPEGDVPREILEDVEFADWSPDGAAFAVVRTVQGRSRLEYPIGTLLQETAGRMSHPRISPDGRRIAFLDHPDVMDDRGSVAVVDSSGAKKTLCSGWTSAMGLAWSPSGREIWFTATDTTGARALRAVSLSGRQRLLERVPGDLTLQDVARDGKILVTRDTLRIGILRGAAGGAEPADASWLDRSLVTALSPDGNGMLFTEFGEGGGALYSVFLRSAGALPKRLGDGFGTDISEDARRVLAVVPGSPNRLVVLPTGPGQPVQLAGGPLREFQWAAFVPKSEKIVIAGSEADRGVRLYVKDLGSPAPATAVSPEGIGIRYGGGIQVAPDGATVAAIGADDRLALFPLAGRAAPRAIPGLDPGFIPARWSEDGRFLYLYRLDDRPPRIYRVDAATGARVVWKELVVSDPAGLIGFPTAQITPDGSTYAFSYARSVNDLYLAEGIR